MVVTHTFSIVEANARGVDFWRELIHAEYLEMPGLHLTKPQVQRLWGIDEFTCDVVLAAPEDEKFLHRTAQDTYARVEAR